MWVALQATTRSCRRTAAELGKRVDRVLKVAVSMSEQITLSPKLKVLHDEFIQRCRGIAAELETAPVFIDSDLMNKLRIRFMAPLKKPRKAELDEELHLIAVMSVVIDLIGQGWSLLG